MHSLPAMTPKSSTKFRVTGRPSSSASLSRRITEFWLPVIPALQSRYRLILPISADTANSEIRQGRADTPQNTRPTSPASWTLLE